MRDMMSFLQLRNSLNPLTCPSVSEEPKVQKRTFWVRVTIHLSPAPLRPLTVSIVTALLFFGISVKKENKPDRMEQALMIMKY